MQRQLVPNVRKMVNCAHCERGRLRAAGRSSERIRTRLKGRGNYEWDHGARGFMLGTTALRVSLRTQHDRQFAKSVFSTASETTAKGTKNTATALPRGIFRRIVIFTCDILAAAATTRRWAATAAAACWRREIHAVELKLRQEPWPNTPALSEGHILGKEFFPDPRKGHGFCRSYKIHLYCVCPTNPRRGRIIPLIEMQINRV